MAVDAGQSADVEPSAGPTDRVPDHPDRSTGAPDPFGTAELRRVVLDAWAASPARFREDANAEEALAVGGYAGRVLVELASNAVDAAREPGVPARIRIRLVDGELRVANTGAPLTADGVAGAGLPAGVGQTRHRRLRRAFRRRLHRGAVLVGGAQGDLDDRRGPLRRGRHPGRDRRACAPPLDRELTGGARPGPGAAAALADRPGRGTAARRFRHRGPAAADCRPRVADVQRPAGRSGHREDLFWALPDLTEIDLPDRVVRRGIRRPTAPTVIDDGGRTAGTGRRPDRCICPPDCWPTGRSRNAAGALAGHLGAPVSCQDLADLDGLGWTAWPAGRSGRRPSARRRPTDEPLTLPARLIGTFPVDDTRRRLAPGPLCDYLLERAADAYLDLVAGADAGRAMASCCRPPASRPGPVDGDAARRDRAPRASRPRCCAPPPAISSTPGRRLRAARPGRRGCRAVRSGDPRPAAADAAGRRYAVLRPLGTSTLSWSQASAALAGMDRPPTFWWQVYRAAADAERPTASRRPGRHPGPADRWATRARRPRLPAAGRAGRRRRHRPGQRWIDPELARRLGAVVPACGSSHPDAAHPLLTRLGAAPAEPSAVLADPALADRVGALRRELEEVDVEPDEVRSVAGRRPGPDRGGRRTRLGAVLAELVLTDRRRQPLAGGGVAGTRSRAGRPAGPRRRPGPRRTRLAGTGTARTCWSGRVCATESRSSPSPTRFPTRSPTGCRTWTSGSNSDRSTGTSALSPTSI